MFLKIVRRSFTNMRDSYLIYVLACSFAIGIFSVLLSLVDNPKLKTNISIWSSGFANITLFFSILFIFCAFVYMGFVGGFFIKQQAHEFKTFDKFGMSRFTILIIGFIQTMLVQLVSWVIGILIALIFQKFFGMLLLYLMGVKSGFSFLFTSNTFNLLIQIGIYSTLVFSVMNSFRVNRLLKDKNNKKISSRFYLRIPAGFLGVLFFISGLFVTIVLISDIKDNQTNQVMQQLIFLFVAYLLGSYLIYFGFLPSLLTILQHIKWIAYTGINVFSFKYFKERLIRNNSVLWFITELSSLALILLSICYFSYQTAYSNYLYAHPFELTANQYTVKDIKNDLKENNSQITREYKTTVKTTVVKRGSNGEIIPGTFMSYSDYQKLPKSNVAKNPKISKNQFLILDFGYNVSGYNFKKPDTAVVSVKNAKQIKSDKIGSAFPYGSTMYQGLMIIAPDNYYNKLQADVKNTFYGWFFKDGDKLTHKQFKKLDKQEYTRGVLIKKADNLNDTKLSAVHEPKHYQGEIFMDSNYSRQKTAKIQVDQISGFGIFIVALFSVALLIALGSVLTLKLLLRDDSEWKQLRTLNKIGVDKGEIKEIVKKETIYTFVIPIVFAVMQSYIVIALIGRFSAMTMIVPFILINLCYIALYGIIGFVTYLISWRSVDQKLN
ncbi:ABC transporter permease family protein [Companilactobacillus baiquanensis]|uniref:ABC transporter permease n=1 Tax=Companilactobacillus baiquanensis TaxID=2486005 RepID=A0ABW1UWS7_9LACO|nr:hypothetical protein [Companilactobacillus baiquanensis]